MLDLHTRQFKMESIQNVLNVIKKDAFMASNDLKDAFYSVPVAAHHQKYLFLFFLQMNIVSLHACQMGMESLQRSRKYHFQYSGCRHM